MIQEINYRTNKNASRITLLSWVLDYVRDDLFCWPITVLKITSVMTRQWGTRILKKIKQVFEERVNAQW